MQPWPDRLGRGAIDEARPSFYMIIVKHIFEIYERVSSGDDLL